MDGAVYVPVPFDPDAVWGTKTRHVVSGTIGGLRVRGGVQRVGDDRGVVLGPAWRRDHGLAVGSRVQVVIEAEGAQRDDLPVDVAAALAADAQAGEAFDALAQFYRRAFLDWFDATKRRPEHRPLRVAEMVGLLRAGRKQRPCGPTTRSLGSMGRFGSAGVAGGRWGS
ncbi:MAG: YdeI/OmpD-associated family protein, partial [Chloroflexi bacterium]|nr:YdeI/OmpD-associated family protein [Chloroflexota bacterium]